MNCIKCGATLLEGANFCHVCGKKQSMEQPTRKRKTRGNGTGTAFKRGNTWTARAAGYSFTTTDGETSAVHRIRPSRGGFRTKKDALEWAMSMGKQAETHAPSLLLLWTGWSENDMEKLSKDKQAAYKKARQRLEPIIARSIDTLTLDDLQSVVNEKATSYYTARDMKSLLSHLYTRAMASNGARWGVTVNLSRFIVLPTLEEKEPEAFSESEINKIWEAWDSGLLFSGFLLLMIYSSMMPGELLSCKKEMIDFEKCEIYGCGRKTKKRKETPIVFPEFIAPVLTELCNSEEYSGDMLCPMCETIFYRAYHASTVKIGIRDLPPYACRHTTATAAVKKGVDLSVIQQIMRHSKLASTQRYIHVAPEAMHAGINKL